MTAYTQRVTIATPIAILSDANALAQVVGEAFDDIYTFKGATHVDAAGNLYSVCSTSATSTLFSKYGSTLQAPPFAPNADLAAAQRAQVVIHLNPGQPADPAVITAVTGADALAAVASMGLLDLDQV